LAQRKIDIDEHCANDSPRLGVVRLRGHRYNLAVWVVLAIGFQVAAPLASYWYMAIVHQGYCHQHHRFESLGSTFNGSPDESLPKDEALQHDDWSKYLFDLSHTQPSAPTQVLSTIEDYEAVETPKLVAHLPETQHPVIRAPKHSPPVS